MIYLLYIATGYLVITSVILLRNRLHFSALSSPKESRYLADAPRISICIPARNEERNIQKCITSALDQDYPNLEVLVLDDHSTDNTGEILSSIKGNHPRRNRLTLLQGNPKPDDWLGKPWACQQLGEAAEGDILVFADADTWFERQTAARVVRTMGRDVVDMLTVWPRQQLGSFWEKMLIPLVYYALLSLLPVQYVYRKPRWMPTFLKKKFAPLFAAACGQFMAFKKKVYDKIGGHQSVKSEVLDDVKLAKRIKSAGFTMRMYYGSKAVACRMYRSEEEIRGGFRKNFLAGFGYNLPVFILTGLLHVIVFLVPAIILPISVTMGNTMLLIWSAMPVALMLIHRFLMARWFGWQARYGLLHPVSVLWFQWLSLIVISDYLNDRDVQWKGREL